MTIAVDLGRKATKQTNKQEGASTYDNGIVHQELSLKNHFQLP